MVQLPATAAIECRRLLGVRGRRDFCPGGLLPGGLFPPGSFARGHFWPGGLLSGGLMPIPPTFNACTHRLGFL